MKIILRILTSPLVFAFIFIRVEYSALRFCFVGIYKFIRYGGEFNAYNEDTIITMRDIYEELKKGREQP